MNKTDRLLAFSRIRKSLRLLAPGKQADSSNERENLDKIMGGEYVHRCITHES